MTQMGMNTYEAVVKKGGQRTKTASAIRINRSLSAVAAVPLTESVGMGVLAGTGRSGRTKMLWLARRGAELPVQGSVDLVAHEPLEAGEERSINLKVYTGEHDRPEENQAHGVLRIKGTDLDEGRIEEGAKLECRFQILEGGQLKLTVKAPDVRQEFSDRNYYVHEEGAIDYRKAAESIKGEAGEVRREVENTQDRVDDERLRRALVLLDGIEDLSHEETDPETVKEHHDRAGEARNLLSLVRKDHRPALLQMEVDKVRTHWNKVAAAWAEDGTKERIAKLFDAASRAAEVGDEECEDRLDDIRSEILDTLWKQDWFVVETFKQLRTLVVQQTGAEAASLIKAGDVLATKGDTERLREVVQQMVRLSSGGENPTGEARWLLEDINIRSA